MEPESLGQTIRNALLRYADVQRINTWDYRAFREVWNTVLSGSRTMIAAVVGAVLCLGAVGFILARKRAFTQKDTLCVFIYMVVTIFLLESVQKMLKINVTVDSAYANLEVIMPKSELFLGGSGKKAWCESGLDRELEARRDEQTMGPQGSKVYRRLLRNRMARKARPNQGTFVVDKASGQIVGESTPKGYRIVGGSASAPIKSAAEYCIFRGPAQRCRKNGCLYLEADDFNEAATEMRYINKVNRDYAAVQRKMQRDRNSYTNYSVSLLENFRELAKIGELLKDELGSSGVSFKQMENSLSSLTQKYNTIFAADPANTTTEIAIDPSSICVSVSENSAASKRYLRSRRRRAVADTLAPAQTVERTEKVTIHDSFPTPSARSIETRPLARSARPVRAELPESDESDWAPHNGNASFLCTNDDAVADRRSRPFNSFLAALRSALVPKSWLRKPLSTRPVVSSTELSGSANGYSSGYSSSYAPGSTTGSSAGLPDNRTPYPPDSYSPYPPTRHKRLVKSLPADSTVRPEDNGFFWSISSTLSWAEILMFFQVFLVLGVIISVVFDLKILYLLFYFAICISLALVLVLGAYSFTYATGLSSLCREGLGCRNFLQAPPTAKKVSEMIDIPQRVLKDSVTQSENQLQNQIDTLLNTNTSEDLEELSAQLSRLRQLKGDFNLLLVGNPNRDLINKRQFYSYANKMNSSLNSLKSLDAKVRSGGWSDTFKELVQVNILITDTSRNGNIKRRETLLTMAGGTPNIDPASCSGKEVQVCTLKERFDSLFTGLALFSILLPVIIAI